MTTTRRTIIISIASIAAIVAISTAAAFAVTSNTGAPSRQPSAAASPSTLGPVESAAALIRELDRQHLVCSAYEPIDSPTGARERGRCWVGSKEIVIGIYVDSGGALAQWDRMAGLMTGVATLCMATGANWTVSGESCQYVRQVADVTGARYQQTP